MMTDAQLGKRDKGRNIGLELLAAAQEMAVGRWARKTTFEALPDGSVRRTVVQADGILERQEVLVGPQWQLLCRALGLRYVAGAIRACHRSVCAHAARVGARPKEAQ
jgi:hypothetical protein